MVAYAGAISRAFPIYNQKTGQKCEQKVQVGFILVKGDSSLLSAEEVKCLNALCEGVRLAQEIVDLPTNFMHTDAFLEVRLCTIIESPPPSLTSTLSHLPLPILLTPLFLSLYSSQHISFPSFVC